MGRHTSIAIRMALVTMVLFGVVYPLAMTGIAQALFPRQANGSLISSMGCDLKSRPIEEVVGSELIGQQFTGPGYFHPRPSAAGKGYDATSSGGSNLGPTSRKFVDDVRDRARRVIGENPGLTRGRIPVDMVTASGSGLDPDISVANAYAQASRVAKVRGVSRAVVRNRVRANTTKRTFGFLGEPRVNVLRINRALDRLSGTLK
jgi:potassium-transporting ATPase KdpC subunit